jgi:hypothetical protein
MRTRMRVIQGQLAEVEPHRTSAIEAAYQHFRLDKQGSLVSPKTLRRYDWTIWPRPGAPGRPGLHLMRRTRADLFWSEV